MTTVQTPEMLSADRLEEEVPMRRHDLSGRAALVTGDSPEPAAALAAAGAAVVVAGTREDLGRETGAAFVRLDVTDDASWERAVTETIARLGGLDIVVNNADVELPGPLADLDPAALRRMLDVNVLGTALGIKHAFRAMRPGGAAGKGGAVVNIASVAATTAVPGTAAYSASKSAVDRLTRVAAAEAGKLGYDVRVNCVYPDAGRLGEGTLADAVVFLASDAAQFVTGAGLPVDSGPPPATGGASPGSAPPRSA
ncbi:SDR family oxidoreductase [Amycolatopsis sp. RTGN1]|uniref:SDR family oxidoreductase n=1 Tax=Amycolatopsis ponsaeliensis TaxID=2992142 RepID=UPI00254FAB7C|nr:SDR family oxidoreductase [Amycolatopsis sp. RTGN1]